MEKKGRMKRSLFWTAVGWLFVVALSIVYAAELTWHWLKTAGRRAG
jgi:uncharacterized membrane protein YhaH (DUF805 family)